MSEFKGNLGNYKIIKTEDNTETVWSEFFDEACHNLSGAYDETIHNYIQGCNIDKRFTQNNDFTILDVGFGVGIGLKAVIDQLELNPNFKNTVTYYSIEMDQALLDWSLKTTLPFLNLEQGLNSTRTEKVNFYFGQYKNIDIKIFIGDGRSTLPLAFSNQQILPIHAIFQDAFSPKKNPSLWTVEWFSFLKCISHPTVLLSTYSASVSIRKSLLAAEWNIENTKGFKTKKTMTKANLQNPTALELIEQLDRSPALELHDKSITIKE